MLCVSSNIILLTLLVIVTIMSVIAFYNSDRKGSTITIQKEEISMDKLMRTISNSMYDGYIESEKIYYKKLNDKRRKE